jgi:hypothetical protein
MGPLYPRYLYGIWSWSIIALLSIKKLNYCKKPVSKEFYNPTCLKRQNNIRDICLSLVVGAYDACFKRFDIMASSSAIGH